MRLGLFRIRSCSLSLKVPALKLRKTQVSENSYKPVSQNIYVVHTFFLAITIPSSLVASVYAHSDTVAGQDLQTIWSPRVAACGPVVRGLSCGI